MSLIEKFLALYIPSTIRKLYVKVISHELADPRSSLKVSLRFFNGGGGGCSATVNAMKTGSKKNLNCFNLSSDILIQTNYKTMARNRNMQCEALGTNGVFSLITNAFSYRQLRETYLGLIKFNYVIFILSWVFLRGLETQMNEFLAKWERNSLQ